MPYISQSKRKVLAKTPLLAPGCLLTPSELSYITYHLACKMGQNLGGNFTAYSTVLGVLEAVKQEYYRQVVAPYEEGKRSENGDVG